MGYEMSATDPMKRGTMEGWVKRIGEIVGFEYNTICYSLCYAADNNIDKNGRLCPSSRP